ncbi:MAG TPA: hypothetical protein VFW94_23380 [Candidatus Acidoferrales bacterium]|nr:hypothetical protein [Candidatus Acidoferrales bacterium]
MARNKAQAARQPGRGEPRPLRALMIACAQDCQLSGIKLHAAEEMFLRAWVAAGLERNGNNQSALADSSGVHRNTISRIMRDLGLEKDKKKRCVYRPRNQFPDSFSLEEKPVTS